MNPSDQLDELGRRAGTALRREADVIADTDRALARVIAAGAKGTGTTGPRRFRPRRRAVAAAVLAAAAAGAVVVVVADRGGDRVVTTERTTLPPGTSTAAVPPTAAPTATEPLPSVDSTVAPPGPPEAWTPTQPAEPAPPQVDELPHLLVLLVADDHVRYRRESDNPPRGEGAYVQAFSTADGRGSLYVQTNTGPPLRSSAEMPAGTIGPWTVTEMPGYAATPRLVLEHGDIRVLLDSDALTGPELRRVAAQLGPRADGGPGWEVGPLPPGLQPVGAGHWWAWGGRSDVVLDAAGANVSQLKITVGVPGSFSFPLAPILLDGQSIVDFDGRRAWYEQSEAAASLFWEYEPGVYAQLWLTGRWSPDALVQEARTRIERFGPGYKEVTPVLPSSDGCPPVYDC